jgi:GR25 family glycosyltransferase involved in LPS biosynthesis
MNRNTLLIICIVLVFVYHFYVEYDLEKKAKETFDNAKIKFFNNIHQIYYINLGHRPDRNDEFLSNFSEEDANKIHRIDGIYEPENGALGCLKSHIKALEYVLAQNADASNQDDDKNILVCEDDFYIKDIHYCNRMLEYSFKVLPRWDVIMLAQNTHDSNDTEYVTDNNEKIIKIKHSATAAGYLLKKSYIPRLLEIYKNDLDKYTKTGEWSDFYCVDVSWVPLQQKDEWFAFYPTVANQRASYSDIQKGMIDYGY